MKFTPLKEIQNNTIHTETFYGLNHNLRIDDGEFYDMKNLSSREFPVLTPRAKRGIYPYPNEGTHKINGVIAKDVLCYVDGTDMYIDGVKVDDFTLEDSSKSLVNIGAYIIILPDRKYINTKDLDDRGSIEASFETSGTVTYTMCRIDGTEYEDVTVSDDAPESPSNLDYWIDTSSDPHVLKQYSKQSDMWTTIATTYVRIASKDISKNFAQYDGVKLSGINESIEQLKDLEDQTSILYEVHRDEDNEGEGDYIVVIGFLDEVATQTTKLSLLRQMPVMDFVIESGNRLWGCRYGTNINGDVVNEIYASKQGDFKNWNSYMGISTDSYTASIGTDGEWTGAISHMGYPIFFKENYMHKVYGSMPSQYQIQSTECRGVMKGAGKSLAILNEQLIYKSRYGVCVYDGSLPTDISQQFGGLKYSAQESDGSSAVAGCIGYKYYISMKSEEDSKWYLLVYDSQYGTWYIEDETRVDDFSTCDGEMYFIDHDSHQLMTVNGSGSACESDIEWMAETGIVGTNIRTSSRANSPLPGKKYVQHMLVRMSMDIGAVVRFYIQYDSFGQWEHITTVRGTSLRSFDAPIRPKRCDHFRIRMEGKGNVRVFSITKYIERGSEY